MMITTHDLAFFLDIDLDTFQKSLASAEKEGQGKKHSPSQAKKIIEQQGKGVRAKTITIAALKGGIGKTFLSTHVAARASMLGMKVLLIDLDPEACASNSLLSEQVLAAPNKLTLYDIENSGEDIHKAIISTKYEGLDIIPSSLRISKAEKLLSGKNPKTLLRKYLDPLSQIYDFIFLELPPSFSTLTSSAYLSSDTILIPCTPNIHSLESVELTIEAVKEVAAEFEVSPLEFKVIMNMFNSKRNASQDILQILQEDFSSLLLPFQINESAEIQNAINAGLTIFESRCALHIRNEIDCLVKTLCPLLPLEMAKPFRMERLHNNSTAMELSSLSQ